MTARHNFIVATFSQVLCRNLIVGKCSTASTNWTIPRGPKSLPKHPPAEMLSLPLPPKMIRFLESPWPVERRQRRTAENATSTTTSEGDYDEFPDELGYMDQLVIMRPITRQTLRTLFPRGNNDDSASNERNIEEEEAQESDEAAEDYDDDDGVVRFYDEVRCSDSEYSDDDDDDDDDGRGGGGVDGWSSQLFPDIRS